MESISPEDVKRGENDSVDESDVVKSKKSLDDGRGLEDEDPELNELLDSSLADFGKHVPPLVQQDIDGKGEQQSKEFTSLLDESLIPPTGEDQLMKEMEEVFGEEFAKQAEAQLSEAMSMLKADNPELLKQFEELAKTVGLEEGHTPSSGRGLEPGNMPTPGDSVDHTLQSAVEDTLKRIQQSSKCPPSDIEGIEGMSSQLTDMMGNLDLGENGEGEEQVLKMMENMMSTLLSKEVLYPSLVDFCKQYPEWLDRHCQELSNEDKSRYSNQLRIMKLICKEFEKDGDQESERARQETILKLMQELQQYGQPPEDMGGMPLQSGFPSSFLPTPDGNQCLLM